MVVVVVLKVPLVLVARGGRGGNPWAPMNGCWCWSLLIDMDATRLLLLMAFRSALDAVEDPEGSGWTRILLVLLRVDVLWSLMPESVSSLDREAVSSSSVSRGVWG